MSKHTRRPGLHGLVPRTLAALRTAAADLPRPGAVGTQVLRALLVLAAVPTGCVAQPAPVMMRIAQRSRPATMGPAHLVQLQRSSSLRGDRA